MSTIENNLMQPQLLCDLARVKLNPHFERLLAAAQAHCAGPTVWRHRKGAEARDLLSLAQISRRFRVLWLDLRSDLRAVIEMRVPTPCLPEPSRPLQVAGGARIGVIYREEAVLIPQPGLSYVHILAPSAVWHPNVSQDVNQALCLGTSLPAGIPIKELLLMTYGALTMRTVQMNPRDSAGVMNPAAAEWWQRNADRIPLSRQPFLEETAQAL